MTVTTSPNNQPGSALPSTFKPDVAIVGLGYVGLPLAMTFADAGVSVLGIDVDASKVEAIRCGSSYIDDIPDEQVARHVGEERFAASVRFGDLAKADAIIIAVPTPLSRNREPDLSLVEAAARRIAPHLQQGQLVVLESTTYPGTTRDLLLPIFSADGLVAGRDFFLAYSPERVDPGNPTWQTRNTPKVVGGVTAACTDRAVALYERAIDTVQPVTTPEAAEMTKLFENIFRSVNIALVNELAMLCDRMGIDIWEVVEAAATKPFGFMKFTPGPGLGGHCIPIDPFYLTWKAREYDFSTEFIELAGKINSNMPYFCVQKLKRALNTKQIALNGAKVLLLGMSYKRDITDYRESPAIKVLELLVSGGADVRYHDRFVPEIHGGHGVTAPPGDARFSVDLTDERVAAADAVVILTDHSHIDYEHILETASLVVDYRNVLKDHQQDERLWKL